MRKDYMCFVNFYTIVLNLVTASFLIAAFFIAIYILNLL